ncbi:MAG: transglutaminaseTgpA domain-containing protein [Myxococcota bacterium]
MSLGAAHEGALALATTLAFLAALLGGSLSPFAWCVLLAPPLSAWMRRRERQAPVTSGTLIALASLGLGVATVVQRGVEAAVLAGGYAVMGLLVARLLTRTTLAHDLQTLLLSLLLVIASTVLNVGLSFAALFLGYAIAIVWALMTRELLRGVERTSDGDPRRVAAMRARTDVVTRGFLAVTTGIALAVLLGTSVLFVAFPRLGSISFPFGSDGSRRLPGSVSLRGGPRGAIGSDEVVARIRGVSDEDFFRGLYLRGAVYDEVTSQGFARSEAPVRAPRRSLQLVENGRNAVYDVFLSPGAGTTLFSLGTVGGAYALSGGKTNPNDKLSVGDPDLRTELHASEVVRSSLRYRVHGGVSAPGEVPTTRRDEETVLDLDIPAGWLRVPEDLDDKVRALAAELRAGAANEEDIVARTRKFLLEGFRYTLEQPAGSAADPLVAFLLSERAGHCEYFAAGFALLLRLNGIGSRVIGGYQGGAYDAEDGVVVFTQRNAHAWVEWYLKGRGWVVDDATPVASAPRDRLLGFDQWWERVRRFWDDQVLDYSVAEQLALARRLGDTLRGADSLSSLDEEGLRRRGLMLGIAAVAIGFSAWLGRRLRRRGGKGDLSPTQLLEQALERWLAAARGHPLRDDETLREALATIRWPSAGEVEPTVEVLRRYEGGRFGKAPITPEEASSLIARLEQLPVAVASAPSPPPSTPLSRPTS